METLTTALAQIPTEQVEALREAALFLDRSACQAVLQQMKQQDPHLVDALNGLVANFHFEQLEQLCQGVLDGK
jgi:hypothetical protein